MNRTINSKIESLCSQLKLRNDIWIGIVLMFVFCGFSNMTVAQDRVDSLTPFIQLAPGAFVQLGVLGTDPYHDVEPAAVFRITQQGINTTFGKSKDGVLFDFSVTRPLADGLSYSLATRNHGWDSHGFFNDHKLAVTYDQAIFKTDATNYKIRSEAFFAYANQQLDGTLIAGPRLGTALTQQWEQDFKALGKIRLVNRNSLHYYPATSDWQYAIRFKPSWTFPILDHRLFSSYDFQIANAASPFDGNVDRLSDINKLNLVWQYEPSEFLAGSLKNTFGVSIDFLKDVDKNQSPLRSAYWTLDTRQVLDEFVWELQLELQAAAFLAPVEDADVRASINVNTDLYYDDWRYHFKGEYKFVHPDAENDIDIFEIGLGPVLEFDGQNFRPYLAFNVADFLFNEGAIDSIGISGVGFEVLQ